MELTVTPFKAEDMREMAVQGSQENMFATLSDEHVRSFESLESWTARIDGRVVLVGGFVPLWDNRAMLWSYVSKDAGKHFVAITRGVRRMIDLTDFRRLECYVSNDFAAGHRWAKVLGFKNETPDGMPSFFPDGTTAAMYSRIK